MHDDTPDGTLGREQRDPEEQPEIMSQLPRSRPQHRGRFTRESGPQGSPGGSGQPAPTTGQRATQPASASEGVRPSAAKSTSSLPEMLPSVAVEAVRLPLRVGAQVTSKAAFKALDIVARSLRSGGRSS